MIRTFPKRIAMACIRAYQYGISPLLPGSCRFVPSCSHYGLEAFRIHGVIAGGYLTLRRLLRCHPWGGYGFDPVPPGKGVLDASSAASASDRDR